MMKTTPTKVTNKKRMRFLLSIQIVYAVERTNWEVNYTTNKQKSSQIGLLDLVLFI